MKKKVLSLLLAVVMTFSLAVTANAAEETAQDLDGDIVILHTNDVHGAISGYAKVAALKDAGIIQSMSKKIDTLSTRT